MFARADLQTAQTLDAIAYDLAANPAHASAVRAELVDWVRKKQGASTWACEAAGLRLRGGVSVPGWCTADLLGRLLAVEGTGPEARARLLDAVRERLPSVCVERIDRYVGLRPERRCRDAFP